MDPTSFIITFTKGEHISFTIHNTMLTKTGYRPDRLFLSFEDREFEGEIIDSNYEGDEHEECNGPRVTIQLDTTDAPFQLTYNTKDNEIQFFDPSTCRVTINSRTQTQGNYFYTTEIYYRCTQYYTDFPFRNKTGKTLEYCINKIQNTLANKAIHEDIFEGTYITYNGHVIHAKGKSHAIGKYKPITRLTYGLRTVFIFEKTIPTLVTLCITQHSTHLSKFALPDDLKEDLYLIIKNELFI